VFSWSAFVFAIQSMLILQKLLESAQATDVTSLLSAAAHISVPSIYRTLEFDTFGWSCSPLHR